jgi:T-complex protein 1 subunit beta
MNKILHSTSTGEITVTNDGATILKSIALDNPAAKILVNISKVQDDEVGDGALYSISYSRKDADEGTKTGTTSVTVLASEILREAEKLVTIQRVHPQVYVPISRASLPTH